jgi:hypothetical protein
MAIGGTGDRGRVDAEVGDVGWKVDSESDSDFWERKVMKGEVRRYFLKLEGSVW